MCGVLFNNCKKEGEDPFLSSVNYLHHIDYCLEYKIIRHFLENVLLLIVDLLTRFTGTIL